METTKHRVMPRRKAHIIGLLLVYTVEVRLAKHQQNNISIKVQILEFLDMYGRRQNKLPISVSYSSVDTLWNE